MTTDQAKAVLQTKHADATNEADFLALVGQLLAGTFVVGQDEVDSKVVSQLEAAVALRTAEQDKMIADLQQQVDDLTKLIPPPAAAEVTL